MNSASPRLPEDAARRALILRVVYLRGMLEQGNVQDSERVWISMLDWLQRAGLFEHLSNRELMILSAPVGQLGKQDHANAVWVLESLVTVLWALMKVPEMPSYDAEATWEALPPLPDPAEPKEAVRYITSANLRSLEELERQRTLAEIWHWRARVESERRARIRDWDGPSGTKVLDTMLKFSHDHHYLLGRDKDFLPFGTNFRKLSADELSMVNSIGMERQRALDWLCGRLDDWDRMCAAAFDSIIKVTP